ncbi:MAG: hypothetical protein KDI17_16050 [Halioglobus sp.]|nr:hypothetical protein [Halioglobus sp.]
MRFSDAKKLIPSPAVLIVLAIIMAAFGIYIAVVQQHTAQLNQRNFYYLSVTERNLASSFSAVSKISETIDHFMYLNTRSMSPDTCWSAEKLAANYADTMVGRLTATNELFTNKDQIRVSPAHQKRDRPEILSSTEKKAKQAGFQQSGIEVAWTVDARAGGGNCGTHKLDIELNVPYANIRGIKDHPNYFQSVIIFGANSNQVVADTSELPSDKRHTSIARELLQVRTSSAEKLSSMGVIQTLYEITLQNRLTNTAENGTPSSLENIAFTQSDIIRFEMGDNSYLAFVQPTDLVVKGEPMVLVGLVPESEYQINQYSIDLMSFTYISLVIIGLSAMIPIIRLYLFHSEAILRPGDWVQLAVAVPLITTVVLVLSSTMLAHYQFLSMFDKNMKSIAADMQKNFHAETESKFMHLSGLATENSSVKFQQCHGKDSYHTGQSCTALCMIDDNTSTTAKYVHSHDQLFSGVFDVNQFGRRHKLCASALAYPTIKPDGAPGDRSRTDLSHRAYVYRILQSSGFYRYSESENSRGHIERVESLVDGVFETAFSIEHPNKARSLAAKATTGRQDSDEGVSSAVIGLSTIQSFESAILPFGYGYTVIDTVSGDVIFHSEDTKSLRENFFQAVNHDSAIISRVMADAEDFAATNYNGKNVRTYLKALSGTPWTLIVFYETEVVQAQLFHFATTGISMLVLYVLLMLFFIVAAVLFALALKKVFPAITPVKFQDHFFDKKSVRRERAGATHSTLAFMPFSLLFTDAPGTDRHASIDRKPGDGEPASEHGVSYTHSTAVSRPAKTRLLQVLLSALAFLLSCSYLLMFEEIGKFVYVVFFGIVLSALILVLLFGAFLASRQETVTPLRYRRDKEIGQGINSHLKEKGRLLTVAALLMAALFFFIGLFRHVNAEGEFITHTVAVYLLGFSVAYCLFKIILGFWGSHSEHTPGTTLSPVLRLSFDAAVFFLLCVASYHAHTTSDICLVLAFSITYGASKLLEFTVDTTQRAPQIDRNHGLYELAERGSVVVVFLFLVPFNLLLNENFDLHERSWVNFNNWRDAHTVRDQYVEARNSQKRYFLPKDTPALSSYKHFDIWVETHSEYFYFPGTLVVNSHDGGDVKCSKEMPRGKDRLPGDNASDGDFDKIRIEDRRSMTLFPLQGENCVHDHYTGIFHRPKHDETSSTSTFPPSASHTLLGVTSDHYLSQLLFTIPHFSDIGAVLLQSTGPRNDWLIEWASCIPGFEYLCTAIKLPGVDAAFAFMQHFPHTRTTDHSGFFYHLSALILVSFLVLVLMRACLPVLVPNLTFRGSGDSGSATGKSPITPLLIKQRDIVMANLAYFSLANPRNTLALDSLLEQRVIKEHRMGYEIVHPDDIRKAKSKMTKAEMIRVAKTEGQGAWRHVRAPVLLLMFGAVFFAIYAVQDELSSILQIFGSIAALLVTAKSVVGNFKDPQQ